MKDFTLAAYKQYMEAISSGYNNILRFDEFFNLPSKPEKFVLIRHDVDRRPHKALEMALIEHDMGICSTYYFRSNRWVFNPYIIRSISSLGHEIGYHYECLSDADGDMSLAMLDFEYNLNRFRKIVPVKTISMHGRPFNRHDNRDLWRNDNNKALLHNKYHILGEVYLDINYKHISYINDTGRNWNATQSNKRDRVDSNIQIHIKNGNELYQSFKKIEWQKVVFQVHPERWSKTIPEFWVQYFKDLFINLLKNL